MCHMFTNILENFVMMTLAMYSVPMHNNCPHNHFEPDDYINIFFIILIFLLCYVSKYFNLVSKMSKYSVILFINT